MQFLILFGPTRPHRNVRNTDDAHQRLEKFPATTGAIHAMVWTSTNHPLHIVEMMVGSISRLFWVIPAAMLIIAPAPWPYVYYRVLRLVVFVCAGAISLQSFDRRGWHVWTIALALLAVIFNPVLPAHLTRSVWSVLNVLGALLLIAHLWVEREHNWQSRR